MTSFPRSRYLPVVNRGADIPQLDSARSVAPKKGALRKSSSGDGTTRLEAEGSGHSYGWERLDLAVRGLVSECGALREQLRSRDERVRSLEAKLLEANQLRKDTGKRIDELISQLDQLDDQLAGLEPGE